MSPSAAPETALLPRDAATPICEPRVEDIGSPEAGAILAVLSTVAFMAPATGILAAAAMLIGARTVNPTNDHLPGGGNS
jgi:hypothetical protein